MALISCRFVSLSGSKMCYEGTVVEETMWPWFHVGL